MAATTHSRDPPSPQGDPKAFAAYQAEYRNTICGRHPIGVLLNVSVFVYVLGSRGACACLRLSRASGCPSSPSQRAQRRFTGPGRSSARAHAVPRHAPP